MSDSTDSGITNSIFHCPKTVYIYMPMTTGYSVCVFSFTYKVAMKTEQRHIQNVINIGAKFTFST